MVAKRTVFRGKPRPFCYEGVGVRRQYQISAGGYMAGFYPPGAYLNRDAHLLGSGIQAIILVPFHAGRERHKHLITAFQAEFQGFRSQPSLANDYDSHVASPR